MLPPLFLRFVVDHLLLARDLAAEARLIEVLTPFQVADWLTRLAGRSVPVHVSAGRPVLAQAA